MNNLEARLGSALARVEPPDGFAERVLERARTGPPPGYRRVPSVFSRPWLAAAALLLVLLGGARTVQVRAERRRQARDQAQLLLALQIASHHLNEAFERLATSRENP